MKRPTALAPALWERLVTEARSHARESEPAHDFFHVERVVDSAITIAHGESMGQDVEVASALAALLHELFTLPKDHPDSARAGDTCAVRARDLLLREEAPQHLVEPVFQAIRDHSFSKGVMPELLAARVLQDADRLDAIGAIGLARMWATCADMRRPFYSPNDPFCASRPPDDKQWGLDHVFKKLLKIPERLHTGTARELAAPRVLAMRSYLAALGAEIGA